MFKLQYAFRELFEPAVESAVVLRQDEVEREKRQVEVSFSISGVFLEQCEMFDKDVLETFRQLARTGCVELLNQTYYHSISSLYPEKDEFIEQVKMHRQAVKN